MTILNAASQYEFAFSTVSQDHTRAMRLVRRSAAAGVVGIFVSITFVLCMLVMHPLPADWARVTTFGLLLAVLFSVIAFVVTVGQVLRLVRYGRLQNADLAERIREIQGRLDWTEAAALEMGKEWSSGKPVQQWCRERREVCATLGLRGSDGRSLLES